MTGYDVGHLRADARLVVEEEVARREPALRTLLARAVDGGYAREDVSARDVLATVALICQPVRGEQPSLNKRMARVFMEGPARPKRSGS